MSREVDLAASVAHVADRVVSLLEGSAGLDALLDAVRWSAETARRSDSAWP